MHWLSQAASVAMTFGLAAIGVIVTVLVLPREPEETDEEWTDRQW